MATAFMAYTHTDEDTQPTLTEAAMGKVWGQIHLRTATARSPKWVFIGEGLRTQDMTGFRTISQQTLIAAQDELGIQMGKHGAGLADYGITKNKAFYIDLTLSQSLLDSI